MKRARSHPDPALAIKELWPSANPENSVALLKALHILTPDGRLNADSRRKLKQVLHLVQLLRPALDALLAETDSPVLVDLGSGKSYLGFILYDLIIGPSGRGRIYGVDSRLELVERCRALAAGMGFERMEFLAQPIAEANVADGRVDMVTALHACDTATDDAIRFALRHDARMVALDSVLPGGSRQVAAKSDGAARTVMATSDSASRVWRPAHQCHSRAPPRDARLQSQSDRARWPGAFAQERADPCRAPPALESNGEARTGQVHRANRRTAGTDR